MNDSILFLALATIFGAAMLVVGWTLRAIKTEEDQWIAANVRDYPNPVDSAGA